MIKAISTATSGLLNARTTINAAAGAIADADSKPLGEQARISQRPEAGTQTLANATLSGPAMLEAAVTITNAQNSFRANTEVLRTAYALSQARMNAFDDRS